MAYGLDGYGSETRMVEVPILDFLTKEFGYNYLHPSFHSEHRDGDNNVLLRPELLAALMQINSITEETANSVYNDLLNISDNERWQKVIRGDYSTVVPGEVNKKTIHLIDFKDLKKNNFTVTNQFYVKSQNSRRPDIVVFINGIPLVVIEAKTPFSYKDKTGEAFDQIMQYERDIPRLFYSNAFNIVTNERQTLYGATGSPSKYWGFWRDAWPKATSDFGSDSLKKSLWALLDRDRLLDLVAHFIVFERERDEDGHSTTVKKMCRYQQFRAVNKIVDRVFARKENKGLVWHTQGSGKSLTMAYAAIKLRTHLNYAEEYNPNLLILTDRIDLDTQISDTFKACNIRNPQQISSIEELRAKLETDTSGLTLISTIFKFQGSKTPVPSSENWVILVDECHRTQEKDLGAFLRATFPKAAFFGFTGTPVKKSDRNTYENFSPNGESYLDRYSIDDAVADGATVPIHYSSRKADWYVDQAKLDILFDQWFSDLPEEKLAELKKKGINIGDVIKHPKRVGLIAFDIWNHFKAHGDPDGLKAQIVAYDREAIVLYKRALDSVITEDLIQRGISKAEAEKEAGATSKCVYSGNQEDAKPSENAKKDALRQDLKEFYLDSAGEKVAKKEFKTKQKNPKFLIVCDKLLTGFDAPIEGFMYLDSPLTDHSLLQAIARTNRVWSGGKKDKGLIVDYIGISKKLDEALSAYRKEDIENVMKDVKSLEEVLIRTHAEVMVTFKGVNVRAPNLRAEFRTVISAIATLDNWLIFKAKAKDFVRAYETLSPEPEVLAFRDDLKFVVSFLQYGTPEFEKKPAEGLLDVSEKIRIMLEEHLQITGITTICKLRHITDPEFVFDFNTKDKSETDLKEAAVRKATELKKYTKEKDEENDLRYKKFSERVLEVIRRLEEGQLSAAATLNEFEKIANDLEKEERSSEGSGLSPKAYDILKILEAFRYDRESEAERAGSTDSESGKEILNSLKAAAVEVENTYASDHIAPPGWHLREQLRKEIRGIIRRHLKPFKLKGWEKEIPTRIEEYALKNFVKVTG